MLLKLRCLLHKSLMFECTEQQTAKQKATTKFPIPKTQMREQIDNAKQGFLTTPYVAGLDSVLAPTHDERHYMTQRQPVQNPLENHYLISYGQTEIRLPRFFQPIM